MQSSYSGAKLIKYLFVNQTQHGTGFRDAQSAAQYSVRHSTVRVSTSRVQY